jgi:hypothetical protein
MEDRKYITIWAGVLGDATNRSQAAKPLSPIEFRETLRNEWMIFEIVKQREIQQLETKTAENCS